MARNLSNRLYAASGGIDSPAGGTSRILPPTDRGNPDAIQYDWLTSNPAALLRLQSPVPSASKLKQNALDRLRGIALGGGGGSSSGGGGGYSMGYGGTGGSGYTTPAVSTPEIRMTPGGTPMQYSTERNRWVANKGTSSGFNAPIIGPGPSEFAMNFGAPVPAPVAGLPVPQVPTQPNPNPVFEPPLTMAPGLGPIGQVPTTAPGYQIAPNPAYAFQASSVPMGGGVSAASLPAMSAMSGSSNPSPYIPAISAASYEINPFSAASVTPAPTYTGQLPPALNSGNLAGNYSEIGSDMFAEQPQLLMRDVLNQQYGVGNADGLYSQLSPYADEMNALFLAQTGNSADAGTKADFTNWLASQVGNMQRPGAYTNTGAAIQNVLTPAAGSPLESYLTTGDPRDQYNNTANLLGSAVSFGYHPLFAQVIMKQLQNAGLDYQGQAARGGAAQDPFYQYLQSGQSGLNLNRLLGV